MPCMATPSHPCHGILRSLQAHNSEERKQAHSNPSHQRRRGTRGGGAAVSCRHHCGGADTPAAVPPCCLIRSWTRRRGRPRRWWSCWTCGRAASRRPWRAASRSCAAASGTARRLCRPRCRWGLTRTFCVLGCYFVAPSTKRSHVAARALCCFVRREAAQTCVFGSRMHLGMIAVLLVRLAELLPRAEHALLSLRGPVRARAGADAADDRE